MKSRAKCYELPTYAVALAVAKYELMTVPTRPWWSRLLRLLGGM